MTFRIGALAIAVCCMLIGTAAADQKDRLGAPTDAKAQELLEQGNRHYRVKELDKAIELYKQGALVEDAPVFLYNLGQCYRMLGQYEDAIWHYERFLDRKNPDKEIRDYVESFISEMKAELEQRAKTTEPTEPGPETPTKTDPDAEDPAETKPDGDGARDITGPVDSPAAWQSDTLGWIIAGTGAVATIAGGLLLMNASSLESDANAERDELARADLRDTASGRRTMGTIGTIAGAGLLVAGIVKLMIAPKGASDADAGSGLAVSVGSSWIGVTGSF